MEPERFELSTFTIELWPRKEKADEGTQTPNLSITNRKLYQLSYIGNVGRYVGHDPTVSPVTAGCFKPTKLIPPLY